MTIKLSDYACDLSHTHPASEIVGATQANSIASTTPPALASSTGTVGDIRYSTTYLYICVATDTWKRTAISTF